MKILRQFGELNTIGGPIHAAIGVFDGVHLGHRAVIDHAIRGAQESGGRSVVITFHPHPIRVLRPEKAPRLLTSTQHKMRLIDRLGVDALLILDFTLEFAKTSAERFVELLVSNANDLRQVCVGEGWTFGANRAGTVDLLSKLGSRHGFIVTSQPAIVIQGQVVSSTLVRAAVERGDFTEAATLLGRDFTVLGTVVEGNHLGRQLGFPTANLHTHNEQFPPNGVYAVRALYRSKNYGGVANIGVRPTVELHGGERLLELHLFDFDRVIYGEDLEVRFLKFLRPEQKFTSLDELQAQITRDAKSAREICERV
jgi:riboflavin kinase/FMN adenylyltransferase